MTHTHWYRDLTEEAEPLVTVVHSGRFYLHSSGTRHQGAAEVLVSQNLRFFSSSNKFTETGEFLKRLSAHLTFEARDISISF